MTILMMLFFALMACTDMSIETAIKQQSLDMADEKAQIEDVMKNSNPKGALVDLNGSSLSEIESPDELEYGNS
mgnify:CR=1 FL=1